MKNLKSSKIFLFLIVFVAISTLGLSLSGCYDDIGLPNFPDDIPETQPGQSATIKIAVEGDGYYNLRVDGIRYFANVPYGVYETEVSVGNHSFEAIDVSDNAAYGYDSDNKFIQKGTNNYIYLKPEIPPTTTGTVHIEVFQNIGGRTFDIKMDDITFFKDKPSGFYYQILNVPIGDHVFEAAQTDWDNNYDIKTVTITSGPNYIQLVPEVHFY